MGRDGGATLASAPPSRAKPVAARRRWWRPRGRRAGARDGRDGAGARLLLLDVMMPKKLEEKELLPLQS